MEQERLVVAMAAPQDLGKLDELRFSTGMEISPRLAFRSEVLKAIRQILWWQRMGNHIQAQL